MAVADALTALDKDVRITGVGHPARAGDPGWCPNALSPRADHAGAAAPQAVGEPDAAAAAGAAGRPADPCGGSTSRRRCWSSGSAGSSRCSYLARRGGPFGAAAYLWWFTRPSDRGLGRNRVAAQRSAKPRAVGGPRPRAAPGRGRRGAVCARDHLAGRMALRGQARHTSGSPTTQRCCWCSAARRARSRSTSRSPRLLKTLPWPVFRAARPRAEEHPRPSRAGRR